MPVCERCEHENPPGRDFCAECGYYLRWEPTAQQPAMRARTPTLRQPRANVPARPRRQRDPRGGVAIVLGLPGEPPSPRPVQVTAEAGGEARIAALVRNRGEIVDHYELRVEGVPEGWWTCEPAEVRLMPPGPAGGDEQTVEVRLHPPRTPRARAGRGKIRVRAIPKATPAAPAEAVATLTVLPFGECAAELAPEVVTGRRRGRFTLRVTNRGNVALTVAPAAGDAEHACRSTFKPARPVIEPGATAEVALAVRPARQIWIGRRRDRPIVVTIAPDDGRAEAPPPVRGLFRQKPWLPRWLAAAVPVAAGVERRRRRARARLRGRRLAAVHARRAGGAGGRRRRRRGRLRRARDRGRADPARRR